MVNKCRWHTILFLQSLNNKSKRVSEPLTKNEKSILQVIIEESLTNFIFDGMKRKTGMHQETLSRTLARLEYSGILTKTSDGYKVAENLEKENFVIPLSHSSSTPIPLIQTILPQDVDLELILSNLQGKWFGRLRWFGCSKTESNIALKWLTEDEDNNNNNNSSSSGSIQIEALFSDSSLSIEAKLHDRDRDLANAIKASHQLMDHIIRLYSKQKGPVL